MHFPPSQAPSLACQMISASILNESKIEADNTNRKQQENNGYKKSKVDNNNRIFNADWLNNINWINLDMKWLNKPAYSVSKRYRLTWLLNWKGILKPNMSCMRPLSWSLPIQIRKKWWYVAMDTSFALDAQQTALYNNERYRDATHHACLPAGIGAQEQ